MWRRSTLSGCCGCFITSWVASLTFAPGQEPLFSLGVLIKLSLNRSYTNHTASAEKWAAIISLADKWQFERMGDVALKAYLALPDVPPMDKIVLCRRYDTPREYLLDPYLQICTRTKSLTVEEAQAVGLETFALIAQTREEITRRNHYASCPTKDIVRNNLIDLKPSYYHRWMGGRAKLSNKIY